MKRSIFVLTAAALGALCVAGCNDSGRTEGEEASDAPPIEVAPAEPEQEETTVPAAPQVTDPDSTPAPEIVPPDERTSAESVQPESETLFY